MTMDFWNKLAVGRPSNAVAQTEHMNRIALEHGYPHVENIGDREYHRECHGRSNPGLRDSALYAAREMGRWGLMASTGGEIDLSNATDVSSFGAPDQFEAFRQRIAAGEIRTGDKNIILREITTAYNEDGSVAGQTVTDEYLPEIAAVEDGGNGFTVIRVIGDAAFSVAPTARRHDNVVIEQRMYRVYTWVRLDREANSSYLKDVALEINRIVGGPEEDYYKSLFLVRYPYSNSDDDANSSRSKRQLISSHVCYAQEAEEALYRKSRELMDEYENMVHYAVYRLTPDPIESEYTDQASAIPDMPGMPKPSGDKPEGGDEGPSGDSPGGSQPGKEDEIPPMPGQGGPGKNETGADVDIKHAAHDEDWWVPEDDK